MQPLSKRPSDRGRKMQSGFLGRKAELDDKNVPFVLLNGLGETRTKDRPGEFTLGRSWSCTSVPKGQSPAASGGDNPLPSCREIWGKYLSKAFLQPSFISRNFIELIDQTRRVCIDGKLRHSGAKIKRKGAVLLVKNSPHLGCACWHQTSDTIIVQCCPGLTYLQRISCGTVQQGFYRR